MNYYFIKRTEKKEEKPIPWLQERRRNILLLGWRDLRRLIGGILGARGCITSLATVCCIGLWSAWSVTIFATPIQ